MANKLWLIGLGIVLAGGALAVIDARLPRWNPLAPQLEGEDYHGHAEGADHDEDGHDEEGHDEELARHDDHEGEGVVNLTEAQMREFGVVVAQAGAGSLAIETSLPGEVRLNADTVTHVTPQTRAVVREVRVVLGDMVEPGQVLAVLESREIAQAKAAYLSQLERVALVEAAFAREESLWQERRITSEQEYLKAKQALAESRIELRAAENQLHALGFSDSYLRELPTRQDASYARMEVAAPRKGVIVERHVTVGELLQEDTQIFTLADLSSVWVDLQVYPKDLARVRAGQTVTIQSDATTSPATATIAYLAPVVDEHTRTALARVVLPNPTGVWRPGIFVTGHVAIDRVSANVLIPKSAVQQLAGQASVFVETAEGFAPTPIEIGRTNQTHAEVVGGLPPGQRYVAEGSFTLASELGKAAFGHAGHAH